MRTFRDSEGRRVDSFIETGPTYRASDIEKARARLLAEARRRNPSIDSVSGPSLEDLRRLGFRPVSEHAERRTPADMAKLEAENAKDARTIELLKKAVAEARELPAQYRQFCADNNVDPKSPGEFTEAWFAKNCGRVPVVDIPDGLGGAGEYFALKVRSGSMTQEELDNL